MAAPMGLARLHWRGVSPSGSFADLLEIPCNGSHIGAFQLAEQAWLLPLGMKIMHLADS